MGTKEILKYSIALILVFAIASCGSEQVELSKEDTLKKLEIEKLGIEKKIMALKSELGVKEEIKSIPVQTEMVKSSQFKRFVNLQGIVESDHNVLLAPKTNGVVTSVKVKEGQYVNKGDLLLTLDNAILNKQIEEVEHQLNFANTLFEKQERIWKKKVGSEVQYLEAKNNKENLENRLNTLKEQSDMSRLYAPFSGVIDMISPKVGEAAMAGMGAIRLVSQKNLKIRIDYSEAYSSNFKKGDMVEISFPDLKLDKMNFKISSISQSIDSKNRSVTAYVEIPSKYKEIKPNMICVARLNDYTRDSAMVVPVNLIQKEKDEEFVLLNNNSKVIKRKVKTGPSYKNSILVESGLNEGDELITVGFQSVNEGDDVLINN